MGIIRQAWHAAARQGCTGAGWKQQQRELGRHRQISEAELIAHQVRPLLHQSAKRLQIGAQLLEAAVIDHLAQAAEHPGGQSTHQAAQGGRSGLRQ